ncbi:MAG: ABC transporter ATP-binding protein [Xenococcus sp. MO_188.B8]|nr:ABC transporter ATP-binding protein [Xenococcus sp. MO_188.B8]
MTISISERQEVQQATDQEVILSVEGVSKKFCRSLKHSLFYGLQDIATDLVGHRKGDHQLRDQEFWALDNVSFQLRRGEALGLVGKNGSGKSTLLRIIAGLIKPDRGIVRVKGRVAPLIALGAGFNPILTGRENIYANMAILGLSKKEIDERFDDVVEFAEIGNAIDSPVQTYSSGMAARLGFASAIYTEPDILLIDEVLAVGDVKFRAKCRRRLYELRQKRTSFILVSHQPQAILSVCTSAIYLSKGKLIASGDTHSVMNQYEADLFWNGTKKTIGAMFLPEKSARESTGVDIMSLFFRDNRGNIIESPVTGEKNIFCVEYKSSQRVDNAGINFAIKELAKEGETILHISSFKDKKPLKILPGKNEMQITMPYFGLRPGLYNMTINIRKDSLYMFDTVDSFRFSVEGKQPMSNCLFYQARIWGNCAQEK